MKKSLLLLSLVVCFSLTLAGCGKDSPNAGASFNAATTFPACEEIVRLMNCRFDKQGLSVEMKNQAIATTSATRESEPAATRNATCQTLIEKTHDDYLGCEKE